MPAAGVTDSVTDGAFEVAAVLHSVPTSVLPPVENVALDLVEGGAGRASASHRLLEDDPTSKVEALEEVVSSLLRRDVSRLATTRRIVALETTRTPITVPRVTMAIANIFILNLDAFCFHGTVAADT